MKLKSLKFVPVPAVIGLSIVTLIAWCISHWTGFPFWGVLATVVIFMIINGIIAEVEDEASRAFDKPQHPKTSEEIDLKLDA